MEHWELLVAAGLLAGAMNAVAGGGSFITFPALLYAGVPPIAANASSTVALFPASLSSAWAYRDYIHKFPNVSLWVLLAVTFLGGGLGALLLLVTPAAEFSVMVPWLLLVGSTAFAFGKDVGAYLRRQFSIGPSLMVISQFLLGIYGGYFGGAVGIMMMAVWGMLGFSDIRAVNANKNLFVGVANGIAVALFIYAGKVAWLATGILFGGTIAGGYLGARYSKHMDPKRLRLAIVILNFVVTGLFFVKMLYQYADKS